MTELFPNSSLVAVSHLDEKLSRAIPTDGTLPKSHIGIKRLRSQIEASRDRSIFTMLGLIAVISLASLTILYGAAGSLIGKKARRPQPFGIHYCGK